MYIMCHYIHSIRQIQLNSIIVHTESSWTPHGLLVDSHGLIDSSWTPHGLHGLCVDSMRLHEDSMEDSNEDSMRSPWGLWGVHGGVCVDSMRTLWGPMRSPWGLYVDSMRLHEESMKTPWGLHEESMKSLWGLWGVHEEFHEESMRSLWGLWGVHEESMETRGDCKIQSQSCWQL